MDLDYLENALDNIELKQDLINSIAEYCIVNNVNSELQISNMIINHFNKHKQIKIKTTFFILIGQIFLLANMKKNKLFFKHLAGKICPFIQLLKRDVMENIELAVHITMIIDKWKSEEIFSQTFMDKILDISQSIYNKINEEKAGGGKHEKFTKYKKTFLMQLLDIRKFQPTSLIYDKYAQMNDLSIKLNSFQQAYNKIDFQNPNEQTIKRGNELQRAIDDYKQKLQSIIKGYHIGFKMLIDECKNDFSKLEGKNE